MMKELIKATIIFVYILKLCKRVVLLKEIDARNKLTQLFQWANSERGVIPQRTISPEHSPSFMIHSLFLNGLKTTYDQRACLQTTDELFALLSLLKIINPKSIFEFGMFKGGSLIHFLINSSEQTMIHSLDITHDHLDHSIKTILNNHPNIKLHKANSMEFNFSSFSKTQDLVYVDGGHEYEVVKKDSENALNIVKENGVIVWDDYSPSHSGVFNYLNQLFLTKPNLVHIKNTSIVVLDYSHRLF